MGKTVTNLNFFKQSIEQVEAVSEPKAAQPVAEPEPLNISLDFEVAKVIRKSAAYLSELGQESLAKQIEETRVLAEKDRFTVAVVGEFSRGKSTFLNRLLGGDYLPVAILPTTAILTHIRYHSKPVLVHFDDQGKKQSTRQLNADAWEDLTADNFTGNDPTGFALVGVNHDWLKKTNIEFIDTPGAEDLEEHRARLIGKALLGADAAIITISAIQALSITEKLFIEQRLLTRETPFLMLILTMLDHVPVKERNMVIQHVLNTLKARNMNIPVYVPYDVELPDDTYADLMGMDKVKECIEGWRINPKRSMVMNQWVLNRTESILNDSKDILREQIKIINTDVAQQEELIRQKLSRLTKADIAWGELSLQMKERGNKCYQELLNKANALSDAITERLQYEVTMSGNPQKWWSESYPYRRKIELTNLAASIENVISRIVAADARWLGDALEQQFKTSVGYDKEVIADADIFRDMQEQNNIELENLDKQKNIVKVGSTVLSLAAALALAQTGGFVLLATMGVGTGASILSDKFFKKKVEEQRQEIKDAIAKNIPQIIDNAMSESERRLLGIYDNIIAEAGTKKTAWLTAQKEAIESVRKTDAQTGKAELMTWLEGLNALTTEVAELYKK